MREDKLYNQLKQKMILISTLPTQEVGSLTPYWKKITSIAKNSPVKTVMFGAGITSIILWLLLGTALVRIVSLLQYGF